MLDGRHVLPALGHEILVESIGLIRGAGLDEARAVALLTVRVEGELAYDEELAADIGEGAVGLAVFVREDTEAADFLDHAVRELLSICLGDAEEDEEAAADAADLFTVDRDGGVFDDLDDTSHNFSPVYFMKRRRGRCRCTRKPDLGQIGVYIRGIGAQSSHLLELIQFAVVVVVDAGEGRFDGGLVSVECVAEGLKRVVVVAELGVEVAHQHDGILR